MSKRINSLLDNPTFTKIDEPVALFFSYVDSDKYKFYKTHKKELVNLHNFSKNQLVKFLKNRGYLVVSDTNSLAAHPATIVVSDTGIQTPFLSPKDAKIVALQLVEYINKSGFAKPLSKIFAIRIEQLPAPVLNDNEQTPLFTYLKHPDGRLRDYIKYRYGAHFIEELYKEAFELGEDNTLRQKQKPDTADLSQPLYSGRKLAIEPYYSYARGDMEARYQVFATPSYKHAVKFSGKDSLFGLIHRYQKANCQLYYASYDLERGGKAQTKPAHQIETIVVPKDNIYLGLEMCMGTRSYNIPNDDERWHVFKEYCRAAYIPNNDILKQRRINILTEAKTNGGIPICYMPVGLVEEDLLLNNNHNRPPELEDVLVVPKTQIRHDFSNFLATIENFKSKVKQMKDTAPPFKQPSMTTLPPKPKNIIR